jgi:hypothetical protein
VVSVIDRDGSAVRVDANPIARVDAALARAFEATVAGVLPRGERLIVRFGLWEGEEDGVRYVCKLEELPPRRLGDRPAWRWWSPLVRTPAELAGVLRDAMQARAATPAGSRAALRRDNWGWAQPGPARA